MKALRTIGWIIVALIFGAVAGLIIGSITLGAGLLMLKDLIFRAARTTPPPAPPP